MNFFHEDTPILYPQGNPPNGRIPALNGRPFSLRAQAPYSPFSSRILSSAGRRLAWRSWVSMALVRRFWRRSVAGTPRAWASGSNGTPGRGLGLQVFERTPAKTFFQPPISVISLMAPRMGSSWAGRRPFPAAPEVMGGARAARPPGSARPWHPHGAHAASGQGIHLSSLPSPQSVANHHFFFPWPGLGSLPEPVRAPSRPSRPAFPGWVGEPVSLR